MKVYTKGGDKGKTSLIGGERVSKTDSRIEAYGTVDELSAFVGLLHDLMEPETIYLGRQIAQLFEIMNVLMNIEALFAADSSCYDKLATVDEVDVEKLENWIDYMSEKLPEGFSFTLPCGDKLISSAHICRTVTRRAERVAIVASSQYDLPEESLKYLNRLSDYFFTLSRYISVVCNKKEILWLG